MITWQLVSLHSLREMKNMKINDKSSHVLKSSILTIIILVGMIPLTASAAETTTVSINPSSNTVSSENTFTVDVFCEPAQPMKSFEFKLSFNPSLLQINSVTEGNIFSSYNTFASTGTIDNTAGTVADIYSLIIGSGNVTDSGTLVTISLTALDSTGTSTIDIYDAGVTDEAGYLSITVNDGTIIVQGSGDDPPSPPGGGGGYVPPPAGNGDDQNETTEENNPPETPTKPSGSTFVEMGVEYTYSSTTFDIDGDQIRFQFDWGDNTYSDWSEFVAANTTISMSHSWDNISTYEVRIIAQDENSTNSSWSQPLEITVSQTGSEDEEPVIDVEVTNNETTNQTIVFDASESYDTDGAIISYHWDFGDETTGTGINPAHDYENPGTYTVILTVTDNNEEEYSKTMNVTFGSQASNQSEEKHNSILLYVVGIIGGVSALLICIIVFFRKNISSILSHNNSPQKIDQMEKTELNYEKTTSKEKKSLNSLHTQQKIETNDINSIEKQIDDVIRTKTREKIDSLK